jgi:hypothetical protein
LVYYFNLASRLNYNLINFIKLYVTRGVTLPRKIIMKQGSSKDKYKFSSPWEGSFIVVVIAAPGAYVLAKVEVGMLPNTWNVDQLHKYYA